MPVTATYASPNIGNLSVERGYVEMMLENEVAFQRMGSVTKMRFQVNPTRLDHFDPSEGVRTKDFSVVTQLEATVTFTVEEITARNISMAMLAATPGESGTVVLSALSQPIFRAALRFTGTNVVGPRWTFLFPLVNIAPASGMDLIAEGSGNWASVDFTADVLRDPTTLEFFTATSTDFT